MNNLNTIALVGFDDIDFYVISQIIEMHHQKLTCAQLSDGKDIKNGVDMTFYADDLPPIPRRIGKMLDIIDYYIFQTPYQNIPPYKEYNLNWKDSCVLISGQEIFLTDRERDVMAELIIAREQGCRRDYLLNKIWGYRADLDTHAVETHIYRLRQKIEDIPDSPQRLVTIEGGYRLE